MPNFVTSNSFIAKAYARLVFKFARDWFRNPNAARDQPIYVVEVGSGHGKLGFLLAKQLAQFAEFLPDMECSPPIKVSVCVAPAQWARHSRGGRSRSSSRTSRSATWSSGPSTSLFCT